MIYKYIYNNKLYQFSTDYVDGKLSIKSGVDSLDLQIEELDESGFLLNFKGKSLKVRAFRDADRIYINIFGSHFEINDVTRDDDQYFAGEQGDNSDTACAPMPGSVLKVMVSPGDEVKFDQALVIIEAMKMENEVRAPRDAVVKKIVVEEGMQVGSGDFLVLFESA